MLRKRALVVAVILAAATFLVPASPASAAGVNYINGFGKCMSISGGSTANGAPIVQWPCSGTWDQYWPSIPADNNYYEIKNPYSGKCLAVAAGSTAANAKLIQYSCVSSADQRWRKQLYLGSYYMYINMKSAYYISVSGASSANNANLVQWPYNGGSDQIWRN